MMKRTVFVAALSFCIFGVASAEDGEAWCKSFTEASGISDEPCLCVVEAVESEPALAEELYSYGDRDEYVADGSDELKALLEPCVGDAA